MKNKVIFILMLLPIGLHAHLSSEWTYSNAVSYAHQGQWKEAQEEIRPLLIDNPERADVLYDAGVAAYKLKEFEKADAYFSSAAQKGRETGLQKRSYFNVGNTRVALNKLPEAVEAYEKVLELDPDDQKAQHNRDKVKEMIEQQKQQEEQNNNQDNTDENDKDNKKEKQNTENQEQQQDQDQSESSKEQGEREHDSQKNDASDTSPQERGEDDSSSDSAKDQEQQCSDEQQGGDQENKATDTPHNNQANENQDQGSNAHSPSSQHNEKDDIQKNAKKQTNKPDEKAQEMSALQEQEGDYRQEELAHIEEQLAEKDKWMVHALRQLERAEEQEQKKHIKALTSKQAVGDNDQNGW